VDTIGAWMPRGDTLPDAMWARRHRWLLALAWAHVPVLLAITFVSGYPLVHGLGHVAPIVALAALAPGGTWSDAGVPPPAASRC
jgi:hypothetical protein